MLPLALHDALLVLGVLAGLAFLSLMAFGVYHLFIRYVRPVVPDWVQPGARHRHCRYCRIGTAYVHEESAQIEGDDLVEVACYVCLACGLPQWTIARTAVLKKAA